MKGRGYPPGFATDNVYAYTKRTFRKCWQAPPSCYQSVIIDYMESACGMNMVLNGKAPSE